MAKLVHFETGEPVIGTRHRKANLEPENFLLKENWI